MFRYVVKLTIPAQKRKIIDAKKKGRFGGKIKVKGCQDLSYQIFVREGYSCSQADAFLKPWAQTLWQAAERLYTHSQHYRHA